MTPPKSQLFSRQSRSARLKNFPDQFRRQAVDAALNFKFFVHHVPPLSCRVRARRSLYSCPAYSVSMLMKRTYTAQTSPMALRPKIDWIVAAHRAAFAGVSVTLFRAGGCGAVGECETALCVVMSGIRLSWFFVGVRCRGFSACSLEKALSDGAARAPSGEIFAGGGFSLNSGVK